MRRITRTIAIPNSVLLLRARTLLAEIEDIRSRTPDIVFINMDQTAVQFQMRPLRTIDFVGTRAISVSVGGNSTERLTIALAITSGGVKLPPYAIYKGMPTGRIIREFTSEAANYPRNIMYAIQKCAWMDSTLIVDWIQRYTCNLTDRVLVPFCLATQSTNVCLILDSLAAHRTLQVVALVAELGINLIFVPGGLTGRYQPLDVGVIAPFKHWIREKWSATNTRATFTSTERRVQIARLVESGWANISEDIVRNSFNHLFGSYANATTSHEPPNAQVNEEPDDCLAILAQAASLQ